MTTFEPWIAVRQKTPEPGQLVIVAYYGHFDEVHRVSCDVFWSRASNGWTRCDEMKGGKPTHWMPLPSPPEDAT